MFYFKNINLQSINILKFQIINRFILLLILNIQYLLYFFKIIFIIFGVLLYLTILYEYE